MTNEASADQARTWLARNKFLVGGIVLLLVFLTGFLPGYLKGQRLERELNDVRQQISHAELRDLAALSYLQASQRDYGLAATTTRKLFDRIDEVARLTPDEDRRKSLLNLLSLRDPVTAKLATADSGVLGELQDLLVKTRSATASPSLGQQLSGGL